jgi:hypothetical protein
MEGVTTAIVGFIFVCMALPRLVKNRAQFYAAFAAAVLIILLNTLGLVFTGDKPGAMMHLAAVATGFLQIAAMILLMLAVGGLSAKELAGELSGAYEVIRRGGEEKEIIIPIEGQMPNRPAAAHTPYNPPPAEQHTVFNLDEAGNEIPPPTKKEDEGDKGIPLV